MSNYCYIDVPVYLIQNNVVFEYHHRLQTPRISADYLFSRLQIIIIIDQKQKNIYAITD